MISKNGIVHENWHSCTIVKRSPFPDNTGMSWSETPRGQHVYACNGNRFDLVLVHRGNEDSLELSPRTEATGS